MSIDRRHFLAGAAALLLLPRPSQAQRFRLDRYPFSLGVASGDPTSDGVVLWTRLAPEPLAGGGMPAVAVDLAWEVATDEHFRRVVRRGTARARPESAHTVHVDVRGLDAGRWYWYRFHVRGAGGLVESPAGRTRTAPRPGSSVDALTLGVASCQRYDDGFYTAHAHLASEDLHLVLFLGDYIYEGAAIAGTPRSHPPTEATTLADYRHRYALYRTDPDLQRAHQSFPWMVTWDDHELFNDYAGQAVRETAGLRARQRAAYQAFVEHMPLRARLAPGWSDLRMYRGLPLGQLANLHMLDTRQYRSAQVCGGGVQRPCDEVNHPDRTILGAAQQRWLLNSLRDSRAHWQVVAQQIPFATVDREAGPGVAHHMDKWDGYPGDRDRLLDAVAARGRHDTVVLTGDNHNHWVMDLTRARAPEGQAPVATEFVCSSISSTGDGEEQRDTYARVLPDNPHARYLNSRRGYLRCVVTPDQWRTDVRIVPYVSRPGAPVATAASFVVERDARRVARV